MTNEQYQVKMKRINKIFKYIILSAMLICALILLGFGLFLVIYQYDFNTILAGGFFLFFGILLSFSFVFLFKNWKWNKEYDYIRYQNMRRSIDDPYGVDEKLIGQKIKELEQEIDEIKKRNNV